MDVALISNPRSGGSTDPREVVAGLSRHGAEVRRFTLEPEDLEAARAARVERVVVAGGDGSVGPAADVARALGVPLALVPTGTANDFARSQGIPLDVGRATRLAVTGRRTEAMDLGHLASGCPFVNVVNTGLATHAAREARPLKLRLGPLAYVVGAVRAARRAGPLDCRVRVDGTEVFDGAGWQVLIGITGAFGGGAELGGAEPGDGRLDVAVLPAGSRIGLVRRAWGMRRGTLFEQRDIVSCVGSEVVLELPPGTELNVDGEVMPASRPETIRIERAAFRLVLG